MKSFELKSQEANTHCAVCGVKLPPGHPAGKPCHFCEAPALWEKPVVELDTKYDRHVQDVAIKSKRAFKKRHTDDYEALPLLKRQREMF